MKREWKNMDCEIVNANNKHGFSKDVDCVIFIKHMHVCYAYVLHPSKQVHVCKDRFCSPFPGDGS